MPTAVIHLKKEDKTNAKIPDMRDELFGQYETVPPELVLEFRGEASENLGLTAFLAWLGREKKYVSPRFFTCFPRREKGGEDRVRSFLSSAINILNEDYSELSTAPEFLWLIWSTSEKQRKKRFGDVISLAEISKFLEKFPKPRGWKFMIVLSSDTDIDSSKIRNIFDPKYFSIKFTEPSGLPLGFKELKQELESKGYTIF